jgi:hypothetical protein
MWLVWLPSFGIRDNYGEEWMKEMSSAFPGDLLGLDSDFYIVRELDSSMTFEVTELYSIKQIMVSQSVAIQGSNFFSEIQRKASRRLNFRGVTITGTAVVNMLPSF